MRPNQDRRADNNQPGKESGDVRSQPIACFVTVSAHRSFRHPCPRRDALKGWGSHHPEAHRGRRCRTHAPSTLPYTRAFVALQISQCRCR